VALDSRFNPYFTGSTTSTSISDAEKAVQNAFQSLFYWKYHFNKKILSFRVSTRSVSILILLEVPLQLDLSIIEMQLELVSILILLEVPLQRDLISFKGKVDSCFNPYFTGSTTSTIFADITEDDARAFQSLFYWKYHFNSKFHCNPRTTTLWRFF